LGVASWKPVWYSAKGKKSQRDTPRQSGSAEGFLFLFTFYIFFFVKRYARKTECPHQNMPDLRTPVQLAQEVGTELGCRGLLQPTLPRHARQGSPKQTDMKTALHWNFLEEKRPWLSGNPRMGMMYRLLDRKDPAEREALQKRAAAILRRPDDF
jgi:hypothetical protein